MSYKSPLKIFRITTLFRDGLGHLEAQRGKRICPRLHSKVLSAPFQRLLLVPQLKVSERNRPLPSPPARASLLGTAVTLTVERVWTSRTESRGPAPAGCHCPRAGGAPRSPLATTSAVSGNALGGPCIRLSPALAAMIELIWWVSGCSGRGTGVPGSLQPRPCAPGCRAGPSCHRAARTLPCRSCRRPPPTPISADSKSEQGSGPRRLKLIMRGSDACLAWEGAEGTPGSFRLLRCTGLH